MSLTEILDLIQREKEALRRSLDAVEKKIEAPDVTGSLREGLEMSLDNTRKFLDFLEEKELLFTKRIKEKLEPESHLGKT